MDIRICPVKGLYRIIKSGDAGNCGAIISSSRDVDMAKLQGVSYVFRQYEDLDCESPGRSFSPEDAAAFADYLRGVCGRIDILYCCCDAGESRSPAVAAAAMRYLGIDDMAVWRDSHYHPNMLVFEMLTAALEVPVCDEEKDMLLYINQKAFREAVHGGSAAQRTARRQEWI